MEYQLKYKNFTGTVNFINEDKIFFGKIEGINDLITFEGNSETEFTKAFEEAVDDYLEICFLTFLNS